jgi:hypothetical protein
MTAGFTHKVFCWLAQVNIDPDLPNGASKVAIALAPCFNEARGGVAWPSLKTISEACVMSKENVRKCIRHLNRNHLKVEAGKRGRGHSARYWMIHQDEQIKVHPSSLLGGVKVYFRGG